jgi:acyl-CoA synthetase (AMP-forming)/AMP-acid ligase II
LLLHDYFDFYGRTKPNAEFAVDGNRALTYGEALRHSNQLANALIGAGLAKGDRFGFLAKNSIEDALLYFAASKAAPSPART